MNAIFLLAFLGLPLWPDVAETPTNLQQMERLAGTLGEQVRELVPSGVRAAVLVHLVPRSTMWPLEKEFLSAIRPASALPERDSVSCVTLEIGVLEARVHFEDVRREGFFGGKVVDRVVLLSFRARFDSCGSALVIRDFSGHLRDTVELSQIEDLETPGLEITKGNVPKQGFFGDLLEPLILLGSIGVAVYLLFAVRS